MAWSSATLSASELAAFARDRPVLVGGNATDHIASATWSDTGSVGDPDLSEAEAPGYLAHDRRARLRTQPTGTDTEWFLLFQLDATQDFDCVAILNHNLSLISGVRVRIQIADVGYFASAATIADVTTPNASRHIFWSLYHTGSTARRYSGTAYARVWITSPAPGQPSIGEVWFGRRRQLAGAIQRPWDPDAKDGAIWTPGGLENGPGLVSFAGRRSIEPTIRLLSGDAAALHAWWTDTNYGRGSFLWNATPSSTPHETLLVNTTKRGMSIPAQRGPFDLTATLPMFELSPFRSAE